MTATIVPFPALLSGSWTNAERASLAKLWRSYKRLPGFATRLDYATDQGDPVCSFVRSDGYAQITIAKNEGTYLVTADDGSEGAVVYRGRSMIDLCTTLLPPAYWSRLGPHQGTKLS